jgi:predicted Zn-dependent peptidase
VVKLNKKVIGVSPEEQISLIDAEKFTVAYQKVPGFKSVSLGFWFPVGSRHEDESLLGISHFIEHLIFKGTRKYKSEQISEIFDSLGAKVNAFTGKEMTCYYVHLLADNFPKAMDLLTHMLQEPAFRKKDIESERKVILQEIAMYEDSPDEQVHDYFAEAAFKGTPLGRPIIGTRKTVSTLQKQNFLDYYFKHYLQNRLFITAAGNVDENYVIEKALSFDGSYQAQEEKDEIPTESTGFKLEVRETSQTHICLGFRIFGAGHKDRFAMAVLDSLLGGMMSSRLFKEIREKRGLTYSTFSYSTYYKEAGYICAYSGTAHSKIYEVVRITLDEFRKLADQKPAQEELNKAKENVKSSLVLSSESMRARMTLLGKALLSGEELLTITEIIDRINAVQPEDIQRLAREYFFVRPVVAAIGKFDENRLLKEVNK